MQVVNQALMEGAPVFTYNPSHPVCDEFAALAMEVIEMSNKKQNASINLNIIDNDFLYNLTKSNAIMIKADNPEYDDLKCWTMGEQTTGVWIIHRYSEQCNNRKWCNSPQIKTIFKRYIKKLNIVDLKTQTAYFNWLSLGGNHNDPDVIMKGNYLNGCKTIMSFCDHVINRNCGKYSNELCRCPFDNEILSFIDRRQSDRRVLKERRKKQLKLNSVNITNRRKVNRRITSSNRRLNDHRGEKANYL
jgi:hypothetical protein